MTKKICVSFFLKIDKKRRDGNAPIYVRLTKNSDVASFSTGKYLTIQRWNKLETARKDEDYYLRMELEAIRKKAIDIAEKLVEEGAIFSMNEVKNYLIDPQSLNRKNSHTLLELFELHNSKFWEKVDIGRRTNESFKKYKSVQKHLKEFLTVKFSTTDILLSKLDLEFMESFEYFLRSKKIGNNTALKYCQFLASMITTGKKKGWIEINPFSEFEYDFEEIDTPYLTEEQLAAIASKKFASERLSIVRDIFLFSCYTSYAAVEVRKLTHEAVRVHLDGRKWIFTKRQKTGVSSNVPLFPQVIDIIERYKNHPDCIGNRLLPKRSSAKVNEYLKEIGTLCNIPFDLHHHVGRHTFGTLMITKGVSIESVSKMMGHKRIVQTQLYAKIVASKVGSEMQKVNIFSSRPPILDESQYTVI